MAVQKKQVGVFPIRSLILLMASGPDRSLWFSSDWRRLMESIVIKGVGGSLGRVRHAFPSRHSAKTMPGLFPDARSSSSLHNATIPWLMGNFATQWRIPEGSSRMPVMRLSNGYSGIGRRRQRGFMGLDGGLASGQQVGRGFSRDWGAPGLSAGKSSRNAGRGTGNIAFRQ